LHELKTLFSLLYLQGNLCLSYPCLSTICLHNFDMLCDYFLKTGIHACAIILVKDLTMQLFFLHFNLMFSYFVLSFCLQKLLDLYYYVYPGLSEIIRGNNLYCSWFLLLYFTLCPFVTKRGSNFYFRTGNVFPNRSSDFCPKMAKGGVC
jgi:hypothetical protein